MTEKLNKEMLIELVRNEPALWNKREKIYNNRDIKPDLWDKIGTSLNTTGKVAQKSWETLRDSYRKIRKKVQSDRYGPGVKKDISWPHYNAMCFLDDMLTPRENSNNTQQHSPIRELYPDDTAEREAIEEENENYFAKDAEDGQVEVKISEEKRIPIHARSRPKRKFTFEEEALELEKRKLQILESRQYMSCQKKLYEADDDYLFLMSLLPYLKKLDEVQKMKLRIEMLSSVTRELENSKYPEVSASAWNPQFSMPPRPPSSSSCYSSRPGTSIPSPGNNPDGQEADSAARHAHQRNSDYVNSL